MIVESGSLAAVYTKHTGETSFTSNGYISYYKFIILATATLFS